jgi:hypothetical protein
MPEEKVKNFLALIDTAGVVSVLQLVDTTQSENFVTPNVTTSEAEMQRIIYCPVLLVRGEEEGTS